ncbi:MAG: MMPL family transporter [Candidatus Kariarchaeaceae archaeon]
MRSITSQYSRFIHKYYIGIIFFWLLLTALSYTISQRSFQTIEGEDDYNPPPEVESEIVKKFLADNFSREAAELNILIEAPENRSILEYETYQLISELSSNLTTNYDIYRVLYRKTTSTLWSESRSLLTAYFTGLYQATAGYNITSYVTWGSADIFVETWWSNYSITTNSTKASDYALSEGYQIANETLHRRAYGYIITDTLHDYYYNFLMPNWLESLKNDGLPLSLNDSKDRINFLIGTFFSSFLQSIENESLYEPFNTVFLNFNYSSTSWNDSALIYYLTANKLLNDVSGETIDLIKEVFSGGHSIGIIHAVNHYFWSVSVGEYLPPGVPEEAINFLYLSYINKIPQENPRFTRLNLKFNNDITDSFVLKATEQIIRILNSFRETNPEYNFNVVGMQVYYYEVPKIAEENIKKVDIIASFLVLFILLIVFRNPILAIFPLVIMGVAITLTRGIVVILQSINYDTSQIVVLLTTTAIFGAGTNYVIFLVNRYLEERKIGKTPDKAIEMMIQHSGHSVLTSGLAVIVGFGAVGLGSFGVLSKIATGVILGISVTLFVCLTLIPSFLVLGAEIASSTAVKKISFLIPTTSKNDSKPLKAIRTKLSYFFSKTVKIVVSRSISHAKIIGLICIGLTIISTLFLFTQPLDYDIRGGLNENSETGSAYIVLKENFPSSYYSQFNIIVDPKKETPLLNESDKMELETYEHILELDTFFREIDEVVGVNSPVSPFGVQTNYSEISSALLTQEFYSQAIKPFFSKTRTGFILLVTISENITKIESQQMTDTLRDGLVTLQEGNDELITWDIYVGGQYATWKDIEHLVKGDLPAMLLVAVFGTMIILIIALKSILVPVRLEITIVMSSLWAIALTGIIWHFFNGDPLVWIVPTLVGVTLNGLASDFDIFIMTRVVEEKEKGFTLKDALMNASQATSGSISTCGLVMAGSFASLIFTNIPLIQQIGLALTLAIVIDAFVMRLSIVPAAMVVFEKGNWWLPRWLAKLLRVQEITTEVEKNDLMD